MIRPLSYLSAEMLSELLSRALNLANRLGGGYDDMGSWEGRKCPKTVFELIDEYKERNLNRRRR